ncbi:MAG: SDR family oxidoreductase [Pseudomonadota bacterium]
MLKEPTHEPSAGVSSHDKPFAFITGAASGIGAETARHFASLGYRLWLTDRDAPKLEAVAAETSAELVDLTDLSDAEALEDLCARLEASTNAIDLALVNAGVVIPGDVIDLERRAIALQIDVNLTAAAFVSHALARKMSAQRSGHLIATLSAAALAALPGGAAYAASKFGLRGFMLALAYELKDAGVRVSCIYPNAIDTPMLRYEALHGGSALNFVSPPLPISDVVKVIDAARRRKGLEYFAPASDWLLLRLATSRPAWVMRLAPWMTRRGERGRAAFLKARGLDQSSRNR